VKRKLLPGLLLSALFLWLAFRSADLRTIAQELMAARYVFMVPAVALTMLSFAARALRWRYLIAAEPRLPFGPLFSSIMIGFMANNLLPARLGEFLRAYSLGSTTHISRSGALASIVVERVFDAFMLLGMFGIIVVFRGLPEDIQAWGWILLAISTSALGLLVAFHAAPRPVMRLLERVMPRRLAPVVLRVAGNFHGGLTVIRRPGNLVRALICSLGVWASLVWVVVSCLHGVGIHTVPLHGVAVVLVIMAVGTMIPSAPGFIGTLQYAGVLALSQYGVNRDLALSFTLLYHLSQWLPVNCVGIIFFMREQISLRKLGDLQHSGLAPEMPIDSMAAGKAADGRGSEE